MHFFVSSSLSQLSRAEVLRLQKSLKVILRHENKTERLQSTLLSLYNNLQTAPCLEHDSFRRLLTAGGVLATEELTSSEQEELRENPFVVWPNASFCSVAGEALEALKKDNRFLRSGYLFAFISRLSSKEIKAWAQWIARTDRLGRKPSNAQELYRYLLLVKAPAQEPPGQQSATEIDGMDLKAVLVDEPTSPMHWFYRGVLPFYRCLDDLHGKMQKEDSPAEVHRILEAFQRGDLISFGEITGFGEPLKFLIRKTREHGPSTITLRALGQTTAESAESLETSSPSLF